MWLCGYAMRLWLRHAYNSYLIATDDSDIDMIDMASINRLRRDILDTGYESYKRTDRTDRTDAVRLRADSDCPVHKATGNDSFVDN